MLEDFSEDVPSVAAETNQEGMACPISFAPDMTKATLVENVMAEISQLQAWHEIFVKNRGTRATGVAGTSLEDLIRFIAAWIEGKPRTEFRDDIRPIDALRLACEDLKTFYSEAVLAQPGARSIEGRSVQQLKRGLR